MPKTSLSACVFVATSLCCGAGFAQAQPSGATPAASAPLSGRTLAKVDAPTKTAGDQLIERITVEDSGSRINELRVGGETRSITVQPKGGMPAYDVQPATGARTWKILGF